MFFFNHKREKIHLAEKRAANLEAKKIADGQKNSSATAKKKKKS
jgi:hypothetical protein